MRHGLTASHCACIVHPEKVDRLADLRPSSAATEARLAEDLGELAG